MTDPRADALAWVGHPVTGADARNLGRIVGIFNETGSGRPAWAAVDTGAGHTALVPIDGARHDGSGLRVPFDAEQLRSAPHHDPTTPLSQEEDRELRRHYAAAPGDDRGPGWMVRQEEQLRVVTETVVRGRVRMRKHAVTEDRTITVPVTREEISLEHEEIPEAERAVEPGAELGEDVREVVLYEERVTITKEWVPVERVRLVRHVVEGTEVVRGVVRREVVDVERTQAPDE